MEQTESQRPSSQRRRRTTSRQSRAASEITSSRPPDHTGLLAAAVVLFIAGWGGLYFVITQMQPRIGGELWTFFVCLFMGVTGTAIPFVRYLNVTFTPVESEVPTSGVIVRQSIWIALFFVMATWLQIPRALSLPLALFIALIFIVVEIFLRSREIAAFRDD
ncbi:MAG: hypothetical protein H6670_03290 [Anaerolineaceae bacterium]|nr:hypothetical protein [Anaerolineaceae bacterium]